SAVCAAGGYPFFAFTSPLSVGFADPAYYAACSYDLGALDIPRAAYKKYGIQYIAPMIYGPEPIHSTFPIHSLEDMKGKKGRFVGFASKVMEAFGVAVTQSATAQVYTELAQGVIDFADRGGLMANYDAGL